MKNYTDAIHSLRGLLFEVMTENCDVEFMKWISQASHDSENPLSIKDFKIRFSRLPRKLGSVSLPRLSLEQKESFEKDFGLGVSNWDLAKLCRIWMITQLDDRNKENYISFINDLFSNAEMTELATLYSAISILAYPESWILRCAEGIRSNIGIVLDAIILENSYPAKYLDENAWNQLILKAFFTDKDVTKIIGIEKRANKNLAKSLREYVEERQAANRTISDQLVDLIKVNDI